MLVGIAVPLKYLLGYPLAVKVIGPLHGAAFLAFLGILFASTRSVVWRQSEFWRLVIGSCVPFGAFINAGFLNKRLLAQTNP